MTLGLALGGRAARAEPGAQEKPTGEPVNCGVIGLGAQGREILASLAKLGTAPVVALCDTYTVPTYIKRAQDVAPKAVFTDDYRKLLDNKSVQAVFIATPSHKHKQIVLDALAAGKHVYCEAPLASDIAEAREIAKAGLGAATTFHAGLQLRSNKQNLHVLNFVRSGALGHMVGGRAQWHKKNSWRNVAPSPEREREQNWRLSRETSGGLLGEIGIHQIDVATWFLKTPPVAVSGFGGVLHWQDGRNVPDTVQCIVEYPKDIRYIYDATLGNSFDGSYEMFMGSDCAMLIRDQRAWMFKETDAALLGWEVYARKDKLGVGDTATGTGIALVADATKLIKQGKQPGEVGTDVTKTSLYQSLSVFLDSVRQKKKSPVGAVEGYQATVTALKANEAILTGTRIALTKEMLELS